MCSMMFLPRESDSIADGTKLSIHQRSIEQRAIGMVCFNIHPSPLNTLARASESASGIGIFGAASGRKL
jgi:hypothetical protein